MKIENVINYIARDGKRFSVKELCENHEREMDMIEPIMSRIPKTPLLKFEQYVQHDVEKLKQIKRDLFLVICKVYSEFYPEWKEIDPDKVNIEVVGRILDDDSDCLAGVAWSELRRFDFKTGREYQQPYYALHPKEALERVLI